MNGTYTYSPTSGGFTYDLTCTFNNYSEDGQLYLGGQIHYLIDYAFDLAAGAASGTYEITGKIRFNGSYLGSCDFTLDYDLAAKSFTYSSTITSGEFTTTSSITYP